MQVWTVAKRWRVRHDVEIDASRHTFLRTVQSVPFGKSSRCVYLTMSPSCKRRHAATLEADGLTGKCDCHDDSAKGRTSAILSSRILGSLQVDCPDVRCATGSWEAFEFGLYSHGPGSITQAPRSTTHIQRCRGTSSLIMLAIMQRRVPGTPPIPVLPCFLLLSSSPLV